MSDRVDMIHPLLPGRVIHPKAGKTGAYLAGGWELKPTAESNQAETPDPESTPAEKPEPRKRRSDATEKKEA